MHFINRELTLARTTSQPSPACSPVLSPGLDLAAATMVATEDSLPAVPTSIFLVPVKPAPPVFHPLSCRRHPRTSSPKASFGCVFCSHFATTQKGLNHHLIRVHRYGVAPWEKRVSFSSPSVSFTLDLFADTPSELLDYTTCPSPFFSMASAPSIPTPPPDATFVSPTSETKLS
ncbi:hypothetical protein TNCT_319011 [Trichonephila clavata]|uniref:Uncharacterized protein n=1 Tax=Trichonephila clavata TaxID=2740835 RepID=A0A8X6LFP0_TRICU|nr:hypothetical protein TNCT_319011 [Trichonephila clavata]